MSHLLYSAAMTLLSKTLQVTFLSKYLDDMDVDDVALSNEGVGVRLSNVQLKEGTVLLRRKQPQPKKPSGLKLTRSISLGASPSATLEKPEMRKSANWFSWYRKKQQNQTPIVEEEEEESMNQGLDPLMGPSLSKEEEVLATCLRVGKECRVGVLDVRLISAKNLHILVEDAFLTLEIVKTRSTEEPEKEKDKSKKKKAEKVYKNRVLAENALARFFHGLPSLFLRDINVRVIIRANEMEKGDDDALHPDDIIVDIGIEMLSVTDGQDFLANFRTAAEQSNENGVEPDAVSEDDDEEENSPEKQFDFRTKRIRTGRGTDGGITIRVSCGRDLATRRKETAGDHTWARDRWIRDTDRSMIRLSGVDVEGRVYMGEKQDDSDDEEEEGGNDHVEYIYDDFNIDSMLFGGVDYVAPGPQNPPTPKGQIDVKSVDDDTWMLTESASLATDANGVHRYCNIKSNFHKVARGLHPFTSESNCLPCDHKSVYWNGDPWIQSEHDLDSSLPMPGMTMHMTLRDPLEINLDQGNLHAVQLLLNFLSSSDTNDEDIENESSLHDSLNEIQMSQLSESESRLPLDESLRSTKSLFSRASRQSLASSVSGRSRTESDGFSNRAHLTPSMLPVTQEDVSCNFPSYMNPEALQILGCLITEVKLRVHVIRNKSQQFGAYAFQYWDLRAKCVTADIHMSKSPKCPFMDSRLDVGHLVVSEHRGLDSNTIVSVGVRQRQVDVDELTVETFLSRDAVNTRSPWPSTAAVLLDMHPPIETLIYEDREHHAVQLRHVATTDRKNSSRSAAHLWLGSMYIDLPKSFIKEVKDTVGCIKELLAKPKDSGDELSAISDASVQADTENKNGCLSYMIRAQGGKVKIEGLLDVTIPSTVLSGTRSTLTGLSLETMLNNTSIRYSEPAPETAGGQLSLHQLAQLPEDVRFRMLLFLPELEPLERALSIPPEPNSFLRCRGVNRGIISAWKKQRGSHESTKPSVQKARRQEMVSELLQLSDKELRSLLQQHKKKAERNSKTAKN